MSSNRNCCIRFYIFFLFTSTSTLFEKFTERTTNRLRSWCFKIHIDICEYVWAYVKSKMNKTHRLLRWYTHQHQQNSMNINNRCCCCCFLSPIHTYTNVTLQRNGMTMKRKTAECRWFVYTHTHSHRFIHCYIYSKKYMYDASWCFRLSEWIFGCFTFRFYLSFSYVRLAWRPSQKKQAKKYKN